MKETEINEEMMNELIVNRRIMIDAPPEKVWEALTNSAFTREYMYGLSVQSDWKEGSAVVWTGDSGGRKTYRKGRVLKVDQGKVLMISDFNPSAGAEDIEANYAHITYELKNAGESTELTVVTDHLSGDEARRMDSEGFWDRVLPALKGLLEK